ncbi:uncharacterized protein BJ171DRAFT_567876 [Polychytrium aggregatum]|uniref:uncharacterized protein n=1 Tax=Polychytrium aggregatum TaxID=110093 RepID=UPI0022FDEE52|nr:uncharacterized protein BJ171DRAFT_567876 [Polychytrium aggregatum]KAI9204848.1 hypothetical protein BJ171DRAFT_567876 [Polychytrium aggregatum]
MDQALHCDRGSNLAIVEDMAIPSVVESAFADHSSSCSTSGRGQHEHRLTETAGPPLDRRTTAHHDQALVKPGQLEQHPHERGNTESPSLQPGPSRCRSSWPAERRLSSPCPERRQSSMSESHVHESTAQTHRCSSGTKSAPPLSVRTVSHAAPQADPGSQRPSIRMSQRPPYIPPRVSSLPQHLRENAGDAEPPAESTLRSIALGFSLALDTVALSFSRTLSNVSAAWTNANGESLSSPHHASFARNPSGLPNVSDPSESSDSLSPSGQRATELTDDSDDHTPPSVHHSLAETDIAQVLNESQIPVVEGEGLPAPESPRRSIVDCSDRQTPHIFCPICFGEKQLGMNKALPCGHVLCVECVDYLFTVGSGSTRFCPCCRSAFKQKQCIRLYFG